MERLPPRMDAKKGKTRRESSRIKVLVTPEEKAAIAAKADAHSLSISSYLRRLGLALPVESTIDQRAILDLVKINADLGRLGGLIKMWLTTNADFQSLSAQGLQRKLETTLSDVRALQKKMSDRLDDL
jgi:hypothetical protein